MTLNQNHKIFVLTQNNTLYFSGYYKVKHSFFQTGLAFLEILCLNILKSLQINSF